MAKKKPTKLEKVAYHEAGHVAMAWHLRRAFRYATIIADPEAGSLGHVKFRLRTDFHPDIDDSLRMQRVLESEILIDLAGLAAERELTGRHNWSGANSDLHDAVNLASYRCGSNEEIRPYIAWLKVRCENLIGGRTLWPIVEVVAKNLIEHKTLSAVKLRRVIKDALDQQLRDWKSKKATQ